MAVQAGRPVAGIDLGGTKILAGIVDAENRILGRAKTSTPAREGAKSILGAIVGVLEQALAEAGCTRGDLAGIGVGSPGPLDTERGVILFSANMDVRTTSAWAATASSAWGRGGDTRTSWRRSWGPGSAAASSSGVKLSPV
jgi:predicted NBD/HSP70 family sugar kinase